MRCAVMKSESGGSAAYHYPKGNWPKIGQSAPKDAPGLFRTVAGGIAARSARGKRRGAIPTGASTCELFHRLINPDAEKGRIGIIPAFLRKANPLAAREGRIS